MYAGQSPYWTVTSSIATPPWTTLAVMDIYKTNKEREQSLTPHRILNVAPDSLVPHEFILFD